MLYGLPEGSGASGSRGGRSSEWKSFRGDRRCRMQHGRVPETSIQEFLLTRPQQKQTLKSKKMKDNQKLKYKAMKKLKESARRWVRVNGKPALRGNHAFLVLSLSVKVDGTQEKYEHKTRPPT